MGRDSRLGSLASTIVERVFDHHSRVILTVVEVLGEDDLAAERVRRLDDGGVPIGDVESLPRGHRGECHARASSPGSESA